MPSSNFFFWITDSVTKLLAGKHDIFLQTGTEWLRAIAIVLLIVQAVRLAWLREKGDIGGIAQFLVMVFTAGMILRYYSELTGVITGTGAYLANQIDTSMTERLITKFNDVIVGMESPAWYDVLSSLTAHLHYYFCVFSLVAIQVIILGVIAFGWVAVGIIVLVGYIAVPFMIVPKFDHYFWNWLSSLIQYSFYPVVANAFVFVYGEVIMNFFTAFPGALTADKLAATIVTMVCLCLALVFGFFKIPGLVADIFRGSSGQHTMPGFGPWKG